MSILPVATNAPKPKSKEVRQMSIALAVVYVILAITQLFTFDEFVELFLDMNLPFSDGFSYALAPIIVATEVFAVPFLLGMKLSPGFRWFSMLSTWFVPFFWTIMTLLVLFTSDVETVGFLGTALNVMPGWYTVTLSLAIGVLAAWASWGNWPGALKSSKRSRGEKE